MEHEGSLLCSQEPTSGFYPEQNEPASHLPNFLWVWLLIFLVYATCPAHHPQFCHSTNYEVHYYV